MKCLLSSAYGAQRYFSWRVLRRRQFWGVTYDYAMMGLILFAALLLLLSMRMKG